MVVTLFILTLTLVVLGECGMEPFIVGGKDAKITDFPYVAYLGVECIDVESDELDSWICGSSIINQYILLTAGHCLFSCNEDSLIIVYVGHENIMKGGIATAHSFLIHKHYSHMWLTNDIGLVKLKSSFTFSERLSRVALMKHPSYTEEAKLAGWGLVAENPMKTTNILQFIKQNVWDKQDCLDILKRMPDGTFCASSKDESRYASAGDSGSALVVRGYIQIGIVSSKMATRSTSLAIYTDIGYFYDWIKKNVNKMLCKKT